MENSFNSFDNNRVLVAHSTELERVEFYKKTYAHVAGGVLLFMVFEFFLLQSDTIVNFMFSMTQGWKWLLLLGGFMLVTNYAESTILRTTDKNLQYMAPMQVMYLLKLLFLFLY